VSYKGAVCHKNWAADSSIGCTVRINMRCQSITFVISQGSTEQ